MKKNSPNKRTPKYSVIGLGPPKTGTTSLAKALDILGYSGEHFCKINNSNISNQNSKCKLYLVDNSFYRNIELIIKNNIGSKFIFTIRSDKEWLSSVARFGYSPDKKLSEYIDECIYMSKKYKVEKDLLIFNIIEDHSTSLWPTLCKFLKESIPHDKFPHVDQNSGQI